MAQGCFACLGRVAAARQGLEAGPALTLLASLIHAPFVLTAAWLTARAPLPSSHHTTPQLLEEYEADPSAWAWPGPTRATAIVACLPAFMDASGHSTGGAAPMQRGASLATTQHVDPAAVTGAACAALHCAALCTQRDPPPPLPLPALRLACARLASPGLAPTPPHAPPSPPPQPDSHGGQRRRG